MLYLSPPQVPQHTALDSTSYVPMSDVSPDRTCNDLDIAMHQKPRQLSLHLAALKDNVKAVAYFVQRRGMFVDAFATELVITSLPAACISALDEFAAGVTWFVELYGEAKKHRCESLQVIINNETDTALKPGR